MTHAREHAARLLAPVGLMVLASGCARSHWPIAFDDAPPPNCEPRYAQDQSAASNISMSTGVHRSPTDAHGQPYLHNARELGPMDTHTGRNPFASSMADRFGHELPPSTIFPAALSNTPMPMGLNSAPYFGLYGEMPNAQTARAFADTPPDATENVKQISFAQEGLDFDPDMAPDGATYVFASTRHRPTSDIYLSHIGSTAITQLTSDPAHDVMPSISPDGRRVAFASNRNGSWDIYIMSINGGQAVQLTHDSSQELHPTWSPDGRTVAFCRLGETSDRWEIWTIDAVEPGNMTYLTYGLFPEWQPNGDLIMFQRSRDRGDRYFSVWTVEYRHGEALRPTEIASSAVAAIINPSWSWDGRYVAYSTVFQSPQADPSTKPDFADVWIQAIDGSGRTNLTGGWYVNVMPTWGPDGRIYFVSDRSGVDNIWSLGPEQAILAAGETPPSETGLATVPVPKEE
ncbi:MAG: PD40 domain-containing protein [Phycisphaerales bacterium]|nr:PD40 domain-containing protein [Phycisphaerales bacterium]